MEKSGTNSDDSSYKNQISEIIQDELIDLHGANGYKTIMQTMMGICGKSEKEILTNYDLFEELAEGVFGRLAQAKILDPIKMKIDKIGIENIHQDEKPSIEQPTKILIADDEMDILSLYKNFLSAKGKEVTTTTDGHKCVEEYKRQYNQEKSESGYDIVILDQKMPIMTGLQAAVEILNVNPRQRIIFASGYLEKTLIDVLGKLNKAIEIIEKPFSLMVLENMINNTTILEKLEKININQEEKEINVKVAEILEVLQNPV